MKLGLGAAQFGLDYGIANQGGKISRAEAEAILEFAQEDGINLVDTAAAYGNSESALGELGVSNFDVISKIGEPGEEVGCLATWLQSQVRGSLARLRADYLHGLLLHRPPDPKHGRLHEWADAMHSLKASGLAQKVGLSIYSPSELVALVDILPIDLIQVPFNVIDRRMLSDGWFQLLKEKGVEIHVRSVFLQGLLLMEPPDLPEYFSSWRENFDGFREWLSELRMSPIEGCLRYVKSVSEIDRIIVGVDSRDQLFEISTFFNRDPLNAPDCMQVDDERLVNPSRWLL